MAYVAVEQSNGDHNIGSAFHIGDGVFVTARHVVEGNTILGAGMTEDVHVPIGEVIPEAGPDYVKAIEVWTGETPMWPVRPASLEIEVPPVFHSNPEIDVAAFRVKNMHPSGSYVPLGGHKESESRPP